MRCYIFPLLCISSALFFASCQTKCTNCVPQQPHRWSSVKIVGGGFCDGILFHPKYENVIYARTDIGGAYRWDERCGEWLPMLDFLDYNNRNLMGVESMAVDPKSRRRLYLACGTYTGTNGAILISDDAGKSFRINPVPFAMGGNENGRGNGERMMVDPNNTNIIYMGTRKSGLWRSEDRGENWQQVEAFMEAVNGATVRRQGEESTLSNNSRQRRSDGCGVVFVLFNQKAKSKSGTESIYVGYSRLNADNLYVSHDAGKTWQPVKGAPTRYMPNHAVLSSDGKIYITYGTSPGPSKMSDGALWVYNIEDGSWRDITPDRPMADRAFGYAAVSVDAKNPKHIITSTFGRPNTEGVSEELFRSTDGGETWHGVFTEGGRFDATRAPYVSHTAIHWLLDVEINPHNPAHAIFTTGYGGWATKNLTDMDRGIPTIWEVMSQGIEETVPLELYSPTEGAWLITAIGDYGGFTHRNLDRPAPDSHTNPRFGNTTGVTGAPLKPEIVVRVGIVHGSYSGKTLSYSLDGGNEWHEPDSLPIATARGGHISVSSDGSTWVWTPDRMSPFYTTDMGGTWQPCQGIDETLRVVADQVNPQLFYAVDIKQGIFYYSHDGAKSFSSRPLGFCAAQGSRGDGRGGQDRVYATPGYENDLWIAAYHGLYHAPDGKNFVRQNHISEMHAFGFGAPAPKSLYPALYMVGVVDGVRGFFRSDNMAKSWVRINDDEHQYGLVLHITGDAKRYGRLYVGTHGRGVLYADPK